VPILGSAFVVTAAAARVLQAYGPPARSPEMAAHVERARRRAVGQGQSDRGADYLLPRAFGGNERYLHRGERAVMPLVKVYG
jgi:hypothetical protein